MPGPVLMSVLSQDEAVEIAMERLIYGQPSEGRNSPLKKWLDFEGDRMSLYGYVYKNVAYFFKDFAIRYVEHRTREIIGQESVVGRRVVSSPERRVHLNRYIEKCLDKLPHEARTIIVEVFHKGRSQAEVASELHMNEATFSRHCQKAREQFANLVMENCPEDVWLPALLK